MSENKSNNNAGCLLLLVIGVIMILLFSCGSGGSGSGSDPNISAWLCTQDIVEKHLKAPATADFCSYSQATITNTSGDSYRIKGYVDSENGFGANIRTNFTVQLTLTESGYKNGSFSID